MLGRGPSWFVVACGLVLGLAASCVETDFLQGTRCSSDDDCGRSLRCEARVCGGCPATAILDDGTCGCPGDRVLACQPLVAADVCLPVCESRREECSLAEVVDGAAVEIPACRDVDEGERCFDLLPDDTCGADQRRLVLVPEATDAGVLIVNCPPPTSETEDADAPEFECPAS